MAHRHEHAHGHSHDEPHEHDTAPTRELDAAGKSLSDALRLSFFILKIIMIVLVIAFLISGFKTVDSGEKAMVLRFGAIRGVGEERVLGPGWHWVFPYPIDELVKIPVEAQISLPITSFWYKQTRNDILGEGPKPRNLVPEKLNPLTEGYSLTRSRADEVRTVVAQGISGRGAADSEGSDYSIVHTQWKIDYQIGNIEQFYTNAYVPAARPGQIYFDIMKESITPLLKSVVEDSVVTAMVQYTIDEALQSTDTIPRHVEQLTQQKLDAIDSGIRVTKVQLVAATWPQQVDAAFQAYIAASQKSGLAISDARNHAEQTLTDAAGQVAESLYSALIASDTPEDQLETLWSQVAGRAQSTVAQAQAYRTKVVEDAKASATYLTSLLPEYRKWPELVAQGIYFDAIQKVLDNADEKFILDPTEIARGREVRILINRDPTPKPKATEPTPTMR
ncbi:MAG: SPFH domain-containing protein [Sedimentisphaerales bacterium]|jgi:regulator of protease activity HflC (stomatin/prohibitin superfamily)|nr:SPFH domain-containing protein [Sedimentisphaerales bacterium]HNY79226.1 SPFH domain-containing protein [Sedimentisphaerales bacterium]HOC61514.1 SPFH domain-containing protein [Sedimentisphaerales bacterium]HOH65222.1 SPFH domain-containing protein [Sedimentisphaerales bacterium]HPY50103.1 SPFH domain-containing protein [Sedimentisphaerales bacterium]